MQTRSKSPRRLKSSFGVKVRKVNTMNVRGKSTPPGQNEGYTLTWKKAIVTLTEDQQEHRVLRVHDVIRPEVTRTAKGMYGNLPRSRKANTRRVKPQWQLLTISRRPTPAATCPSPTTQRIVQGRLREEPAGSLKKKLPAATATAESPFATEAAATARKYRVIDFKRQKIDMPATVLTLEYDPNRSAFIALVQYEDGEKRYIIAPNGLKVGDQVCLR